MSIKATVVEETISYRNLVEIWSGPLALCGFESSRTSFHPIHLNCKRWLSTSCTGSHGRFEVLPSLVKELANCNSRSQPWL